MYKRKKKDVGYKGRFKGRKGEEEGRKEKANLPDCFFSFFLAGETHADRSPWLFYFIMPFSVLMTVYAHDTREFRALPCTPLGSMQLCCSLLKTDQSGKHHVLYSLCMT